MASTYLRKDGRWDTVVYLGNGKRRHYSAATEEESRAKFAAAYPDPVVSPRLREALARSEAADRHESPVTDEDWQAYFENVVARADAEDRTDADVTEHDFYWGDQPVGLLLWSDWHIGSRWTNYDQLRDDVEFVRAYRLANPSALELAHLGDIKDNYFPAGPHPTGMAESIIPRSDKQEGAALWLAKRAGDWSTMLLGCHLAWEQTKVGRDPLAAIAPVLGAVNGGYGLNATYHVGNQTYTHVMRHKSPSQGGMAPGNAQRRLDREYGPAGARADVISVSHLHTCHTEKYELAGRHVVFTRSGGYKGGDCFARAGGFTHSKDADCGVPLLIFRPDRHDVMEFDGHHWRDGLAYLTQLRAEYAKLPVPARLRAVA